MVPVLENTDDVSNNSLSRSFSVVAGHNYKINFKTDLDQTPNTLQYSINAIGGTGSGVYTAAVNGTYSFEYTAVSNGTVNLVFKLLNTYMGIPHENNYYLDDVKVTDITTTNTPLMLAKKDYYPFGMPMPNRNVDGQYRYAFQGQEKDPETGMEAFQLRLWDSRIGRWLTPDPYAQYHSPYLGMGNNPINGIDPDGGCFTTDADGNTIPCPDMGVGSTMMGNAGYEWTMQSDGWARSDGYSVNIYGVGKNAPVKVLTELDGLGHTYIQIGDNLLFTNGRYNGSDSPSMGEYGLTGDNVLLRKTGIEVQNFLAERTEKYPTLVQTVENVDASKIYSNLNSRYNAGSPNPNGPGVIDGKYNLLLSNCTTSTSVALKAGGANVHAIAPKALPLQINLHNQGIDPQKYFQAARFEALRGPKL